ncbi:cell filamentation protein Fic [Candidatus Termititenax persephonae]|uniref:Cell filamentation protein Fic n=1 Tax=Candidatus Termititenax persephonae TaxID=2218525 RepID=A0A388TIH3_9BACT|nr:cell filamentation protein Fic [Candidatus Termititenax persephonae]
MGIDLAHSAGQTPLDEDEKDGLLIKALSTKAELDEFEQRNIEDAVEWSLQHRGLKVEQILTEKFLRNLHRRMFGEVWRWAGQFRATNKNLGVDKTCIVSEIHKLLADCRYWIDQAVFPKDEIAVRFKHRLVSAHPFVNGNGRHSRLMADILISSGLGLPVFNWGGAVLNARSKIREQYLQALRAADSRDYAPLLSFARQK